MNTCPQCADEYEDHVEECASCRVPLLPAGAAPTTRADALLGTFHPLLAERVETMLTNRGIAHETVSADERVQVLVDRVYRNDLRAELIVNWSDVVGRLAQDQLFEVLELGGAQPGWFDAPQGAWVDREGRMQVERHEGERAEEEARRTVGPALVAIGLVIGLLGWYVGDSGALAVLAIPLVGIGLFLPR